MNESQQKLTNYVNELTQRSMNGKLEEVALMLGGLEFSTGVDYEYSGMGSMSTSESAIKRAIAKKVFPEDWEWQVVDVAGLQGILIVTNFGSDCYEYPVEVGDRVTHYRDGIFVGEIVSIDRNLPNPTTCDVLWDGYLETDIQWTNKLLRIEG